MGATQAVGGSRARAAYQGGTPARGLPAPGPGRRRTTNCRGPRRRPRTRGAHTGRSAAWLSWATEIQDPGESALAQDRTPPRVRDQSRSHGSALRGGHGARRGRRDAVVMASASLRGDIVYTSDLAAHVAESPSTRWANLRSMNREEQPAHLPDPARRSTSANHADEPAYPARSERSEQAARTCARGCARPSRRRGGHEPGVGPGHAGVPRTVVHARGVRVLHDRARVRAPASTVRRKPAHDARAGDRRRRDRQRLGRTPPARRKARAPRQHRHESTAHETKRSSRSSPSSFARRTSMHAAATAARPGPERAPSGYPEAAASRCPRRKSALD